MNIVSLCLLFYTTHYLQFLDVDCFDSLDKAYRKQLDKRNKIEMMHIIKLNFLAFLKEVRKEVMTKSIIESIWIKTNTILWKIHCCIKNLLTNSNICSFDSNWILKQLSQNNNRFMIFSSLLISINLNKISINQTKLKNLLKSLNFYTLNYQIKLSRVKKTIDLMNINLILARDVIKMLFKTNMTKKARKRRKKASRKHIESLSNVFWSKTKQYVYEKMS
jgi:ribosomal protein S25